MSRTVMWMVAPLVLTLACRAEIIDLDGDGYGEEEDCADHVATVHPDAVETCDGIDNDCDGQVDEDVTTTYWLDEDGDGWGLEEAPTEACQLPVHHAPIPGDCDDARADAHPSAEELCDGTDRDCDGTVDEADAADAPTWYADTDSDGFGDPEVSEPSCDAISGYVLDGSDCDDTDADTHPGATELCDGADDDCDGTIDEPEADDATDWYIDYDGDGYGVDRYGYRSCFESDGFVSNAEDCDDTDAAVNPDALESCNGYDDDCDALVDEDSAIDALTWYADTDGDGYGDAASTAPACQQPEGYSALDTDCDDTADDTWPGAPEACDGVDHDCDGDTDDDDSVDALTWYLDADSDGYGDATSTTTACEQPSGYAELDTDCDDAEATTYPGATETWYDGVDSDCDGASDYDADGDGWDSVDEDPAGRDCDDADASVNPDAAEVCGDGIDNDCDGTARGCHLLGALTASDADVLFSGGATGDQAGLSVSGASDLDGDGYDDLLVGAPGESASAGAAYIIYGPPADLDLPDADAVISGVSAGDGVGTSVALLGDVDGDGYDDLVLGAPWESTLAEDAGAVWLFLGPVYGELDTSSADAVLSGESAWDYAGRYVATLGDVDLDGYADLAVGAPGQDEGGAGSGAVTLFYGPITTDLALSDGDALLQGVSAFDYAGAVSRVGDATGDGYAEILVGARGADAGGAESGAAYLFQGPVFSTLSLADADAILLGEDADDRAGTSVSPAGDADGDGTEDLLVGAPGQDATATDAGVAYVISGDSTGSLDLGSAALAILYGEDAGDAAGTSVAWAGDVDGDGYDDLLVGAPGRDDGGWESGRAYLVLGPVSGAFDLFNADATVDGTTSSDALGTALAPAGDVDSGGFDDVILGAPGTSAHAGAATLFLSEDL